MELGVKYSKGRLASNINAYRTGWENKAINRFYSVSNLWQDPNLSVYADTATTAGRETILLLAQDDRLLQDVDWGTEASLIEQADRNLGYNLLNADAVHSGVEWDFAYDVTNKLDVKGSSPGATGGGRATARRPDQHRQRVHHPHRQRRRGRHPREPQRVKVGGDTYRSAPPSATAQAGRTSPYGHLVLAALRQLLPRRRGHRGQDVWVTPGYNLINFNAGTTFDVSDDALLRLRLSVTNVLDELFIADAHNNSQYAPTPTVPRGAAQPSLRRPAPHDPRERGA